jgi:uncharacterized cysteine cluster protein YcgN (CxxCxxCC family)
MTVSKDFWKKKKLEEMSPEEWEALCDGCGICCLYKVEDTDAGEVVLTNVVCRFLDVHACRCQLYDERNNAMPTCIKLTPSKIAELGWLPETCAYKLVLAGRPLPEWHPLVSGDPESVHRAGASIRGRVLAESEVNMNRLEEYIIEDIYAQAVES